MNPRRRRFARIRKACRRGHVFSAPAGLLTLAGQCQRCGKQSVNDSLWSFLGSAISKSKAKQGEQIRGSFGDGWIGDMTCGACPVQIEGEVDGMPFYFRARGEAWSFSISEAGGDPVMGGDAYDVEEDWGDGPYDAGWMPHAVAWALVEKHIAMFRAQRSAA